MELFEHWDGHNNPYFESPFDFGKLLKELREEKGVPQKDLSKALGITELDVNDIEHGVLPLNFEWAEKYANSLGTTVEQIFINKGMGVSLDDIPLELLQHYQEQGMSEAEMVKAYREYKKAEEKDAMQDDFRNHEPETKAAHHDGEEWTEEELEEIEEFKRFVAMRREARKRKKGE
ncbi:helix-turn-helix transcriptional regulator [Virgibacillus pantothenticus]|nr:helix-turn-helix transcriptional regulator [Virgibacillus pantothenticus]MEB5452825.1 helix-turn-helix transcriptional regulator [Virgibacillus pantothenticus]MEB5456926.1 helix-turn-helix transcriptional regulator [Virgibacillus pantothenticus]MEB5462044.1 helix-turn-helix transcriptional regulator [Virgibacillus pantothenticus]MEB5465318.1 helix-turn-helix transcriptional regulator [Virgibacillus pantothenticus]MEB5469774.1 helix-turn-helix transcriptional regulator [Virgibacillus pantoth